MASKRVRVIPAKSQQMMLEARALIEFYDEHGWDWAGSLALEFHLFSMRGGELYPLGANRRYAR